MDLNAAHDVTERLKQEVARVVVGQESTVEGLLVALLSEGHVLLEGSPGTGKTLLARSFARALGLEFRRVQFTPDLLPGDLLGTNLFDFRTSEFTLTRGPIFTEFLLADEINRTPPKTQAALLEAMQEHSVTLDGTTHPLSDGFMVVATQNPIENEGTYPLPEAQLDRFLMKINIPFPSREEECNIVHLHGNRTTMPRLEEFGISVVVGLDGLRQLRQLARSLELNRENAEYIVDLIRQTREDTSVLHGASPRAANMLATAARALAVLRGRDYLLPDDIKELFYPILQHRLVLSPTAEIQGQTQRAVLDRILDSVAAPR